MHKITSELRRHYSKCFAKYGPTSKGVDWGKVRDLNVRYDKMLAVIKSEKNTVPSFLDVGCGFGGLYLYAEKKGVPLDYTGIDVSRNMISYARSNIKGGKFLCGDVFAFHPGKKFDYVVCNGILTQKLSAGIRETDKFAKELIKKMYEICGTGLAFNAMTTRVNFMVDNLFYKSPVELIGYCLEELSDNVSFDHSYGLYEYTTYLYRKPV